MRILHLADLHAEHEWFNWVASQAPLFDLIIIAGDFLNLLDGLHFTGTYFKDPDLAGQAKRCGEWLRSVKTTTVICSGNHDFALEDGDWLRDLSGKGNIAAVDGDVVDFGGLRIAVHGWGQPYVSGRADILVTHRPPNQDTDLGDALRGCAPRMILAGSVHEPCQHCFRWPEQGALSHAPETMVLVPGVGSRYEGPPNHWIIDTATRSAKHSGERILLVP
jgi:predicted phosphodiesterase